MSTHCTRCGGSGFLNVEQLPEGVVVADAILAWIEANDGHDVQVCDCCGDGEAHYGEPGEHDEADIGKSGPYAYNGGLWECW